MFHHTNLPNILTIMIRRFFFLLLTLCALCPSRADEKLLYSTELYDWGTHETSLTPFDIQVRTHYTHETLTFTLLQTMVRPDGCSTNFYGAGVLHPHAMTERKATPYIISSPLRSITRIRMKQGATGGNCGFRVEARGRGDRDWVVIDSTRMNSGRNEKMLLIDRQDVQLRLSNLSPSQNAYLFELDIYGEVDLSQTPTLASFSYDNVTYEVGSLAHQQADGTLVATVALTKSRPMPSATHPLQHIVTTAGQPSQAEYRPTADGKGCDALLHVTLDGQRQAYVLQFRPLPDHQVTYHAADGTVVARQTVEHNAPIARFAHHIDAADIQPGQRFRGWFDAPADGAYVMPEQLVTKDMDLYAVVTDMERPDPTGRYYYDLRNPDFRAIDHEGFLPQGTASFHDRVHGWLFPAGTQVDVLVGGEAYITLGSCTRSNQQAWQAHYAALPNTPQPVVIGVDTTWMLPVREGMRHTYHYVGPAGRLPIRFPQDTYLHSLAVSNISGLAIEPNEAGYYMVRPGDAQHLQSVLDVVNLRNAAPDAAPARIFIPDGIYDFGITCLTPLSGHNVSLIGQSMEGTVIVNHPLYEAIGTATLCNIGTNNYLQDLTLRNALDYYADTEAGRAAALQDCGTHTILKHVSIEAYQDTYNTNTNGQEIYWEDGRLSGAFDFLCGRGTVFYNRCDLVLESLERDRPAGVAIITAPYTVDGDRGYIFDHCRVDVRSEQFTWGRSWGGHSGCIFLNTTVPVGSQMIDTRFDPEGMNSSATDFFEYNTRDTRGRLLTPKSNVVHFTHQTGDHTYETILTAQQARRYALREVFPSWQPDMETRQTVLRQLRLQGSTLTWQQVGLAKGQQPAVALIVVDGKVVDTSTTGSYTFAQQPAQGSVISVRLAGLRGGFGPAQQLVVR